MSFFDTFSSDLADEVHIDKKQFKDVLYKKLAELGFDFSDIDEIEKLPKSLIPVVNGDQEALCKFNAALSKLHKEREINMLDAIVCIDHDFLDEQTIKKILDELNYYVLKTELLKRHTLRSEKEDEVGSILDFLD